MSPHRAMTMTTATPPASDPPAEPGVQPRPRAAAPLRYGPPALLLIFSLALGWRLWGRVGNVIGDFGRELYVAWQIGQGRVLYQDMAYMYGPLSPYVNSIWFRLAGHDERAVIYANVLVLLVVAVMLYRLLVLASDRYAATVAMALFLAIGAFSATVRIANYNFLTPYAHGATHGLALCLGAVTAVIALRRSRRLRYAALAGGLVGLTFLTKPETFVAALASAGGGFVVVWMGEADRRASLRWAGAFAGALIVPPALGLLLLASIMPWETAWGGWLNSWGHMRRVTASVYFVADMGRDRPAYYAGKAARAALLYAQFLVPLLFAAVRLRRRWLGARPWAASALSVLVGIALFALSQWYPYGPEFWLDVGRGLAVFPAIGALVGLAAIRSPARAEPRGLAILMVSVLAGAMIGKLWLNARLYQYGFILAAPAVMVGALLATGWLPQLATRWGGYPLLIRFGATGLAVGVIAWQQHFTTRVLAERTVPIDTPGHMMTVTPRQSTVAEAIVAIQRIAKPGETLAVFPDGAGINFATGTFNPAVYDAVSPLILQLFGESHVAQAYAEHPPDYILFMQFDTSPYGAAWMGKDYGFQLTSIVQRDYEPIAQFGRPGDNRMPMELFRRQRPSGGGAAQLIAPQPR
jgi:hypothetical protein